MSTIKGTRVSRSKSPVEIVTFRFSFKHHAALRIMEALPKRHRHVSVVREPGDATGDVTRSLTESHGAYKNRHLCIVWHQNRAVVMCEVVLDAVLYKFIVTEPAHQDDVLTSLHRRLREHVME